MKFICLFKGGAPAPERRDAHMQEWMTWIGGLASKGALDGGLPLSGKAKTVTGASSAVADFEPGPNGVGGYMLVTADSLDKAAELMSGAPHHKEGGFTEVYEAMEMPGM